MKQLLLLLPLLLFFSACHNNEKKSKTTLAELTPNDQIVYLSENYRITNICTEAPEMEFLIENTQDLSKSYTLKLDNNVTFLGAMNNCLLFSETNPNSTEYLFEILIYNLSTGDLVQKLPMQYRFSEKTYEDGFIIERYGDDIPKAVYKGGAWSAPNPIPPELDNESLQIMKEYITANYKNSADTIVIELPAPEIVYINSFTLEVIPTGRYEWNFFD